MANRLDLADAQFLGFFHGKWNRSDIVGLAESMGLTKKEWIKLKKEYPTYSNIDDDDINEVDEHFGLTPTQQ